MKYSNLGSVQNVVGNPTLVIHINCLFWVIHNMLNSPFNSWIDYNTFSNWEIFITCLCLVGGYLFFSYVLGQMARIQATLNHTLMEYQTHTMELKHFMQRENVNRRLQKQILTYFDYVWKRTIGFDGIKPVKLCHDALKEDWIVRYYEPVLEKVPIFEDLSFIAGIAIGIHLLEDYFVDRAIIINFNDIIDKAYIIRAGEVQILNVDKKCVEVLGIGSMFGNLDNVVHIRSMVKVIVVKPVDLLYINSRKMYELLKDAPTIRTRLIRHILLNCLTYVKSDTPVHFNAAAINTDIPVIVPWSYKRTMTSPIVEWCFMLCNYVSILWTFYIIGFEVKSTSYVYLFIFYIIDLTYLLQIVNDLSIKKWVSYGKIYVNKQALLWYLKYRLPLHVACILPFELFYFVQPKIMWKYVGFLRLNRILKLFRIFNFLQKYMAINMILMNLLGIVAGLYLFIHCNACLLYAISCPYRNCDFETWFGKTTIANGKKIKRYNCNNAYICSLHFIASLVSHTCYGRFRPTQAYERSIIAIMAVIDRILLYYFIGQIYIVVKQLSFAMLKFEYNRNELHYFLSYSMVSPRLIHNVIRYFNNLWLYSKGRHIPLFLERMPMHLKMSLKVSIYGHHIFNNPIFLNCHPDFLRQVAGVLEVRVFFSGDTICKQNEINQRMYFIQQGNVDVFESNKFEETKVDELWSLDCFGLMQGLFEFFPHNYSFRATTITTIVTLTLCNWKPMLVFFPASKLEIYDRFCMDYLNQLTEQT
ncbi:PREDICTED: uncharacterized protein LOC108562508 [Nicrophorus vespilloides]|uniref:Uncharacterized protein LOC108562508 n=1 Tax=Nicrophorus vespilloides TaxID=110193 RepID=A0ABM1MP62_NICVS|nr:PREDICTED: uncharacterized protein LOC108562508 [Nicrophorus vespilloides]